MTYHDVDPERTDAAIREAARFRKQYPRMAAWLKAGAPAIRTEGVHKAWFGCAYRRGELT